MANNTNRNLSKTSEAAVEWIGAVVRESKRLLGTENVTAGVWAYSEQQFKYLKCDLQSDMPNSLPMSISLAATGSPYFPAFTTGHYADADVKNMAEATHLLGLITQALNAEISIDLERPEVNKIVLTKKSSFVVSDRKDSEIAQSMAYRAIIFLDLDNDEAWATAYGIGRDGYEMPEELREHKSLVDGYNSGQQDFVKFKDHETQEEHVECEEYEYDFGM